jgi:hypothetical protein
MHKRYQRIIAYILLLGHTAVSCTCSRNGMIPPAEQEEVTLEGSFSTRQNPSQKVIEDCENVARPIPTFSTVDSVVYDSAAHSTHAATLVADTILQMNPCQHSQQADTTLPTPSGRCQGCILQEEETLAAAQGDTTPEKLIQEAPASPVEPIAPALPTLTTDNAAHKEGTHAPIIDPALQSCLKASKSAPTPLGSTPPTTAYTEQATTFSRPISSAPSKSQATATANFLTPPALALEKSFINQPAEQTTVLPNPTDQPAAPAYSTPLHTNSASSTPSQRESQPQKAKRTGLIGLLKKGIQSSLHRKPSSTAPKLSQKDTSPSHKPAQSNSQPAAERSFKTLEGHQVYFKQQETGWQATVKENLPPGFQRELNLPVYTAPGMALEKVLTATQPLPSRQLHVILPERAPQGKGYVYLGPTGLAGGGNVKSVHISSAAGGILNGAVISVNCPDCGGSRRIEMVTLGILPLNTRSQRCDYCERRRRSQEEREARQRRLEEEQRVTEARIRQEQARREAEQKKKEAAFQREKAAVEVQMQHNEELIKAIEEEIAADLDEEKEKNLAADQRLALQIAILEKELALLEDQKAPPALIEELRLKINALVSLLKMQHDQDIKDSQEEREKEAIRKRNLASARNAKLIAQLASLQQQQHGLKKKAQQQQHDHELAKKAWEKENERKTKAETEELNRIREAAKKAREEAEEGRKALEAQKRAYQAKTAKKGKGFWDKVSDGIKSAAKSAWDGVKTAAKGIWNGVKTGAQAVWNGAKATGKAIGHGVKSALDATWGATKAACKKAGEGLQWVGAKLKKVGEWAWEHKWEILLTAATAGAITTILAIPGAPLWGGSIFSQEGLGAWLLHTKAGQITSVLGTFGAGCLASWVRGNQIEKQEKNRQQNKKKHSTPSSSSSVSSYQPSIPQSPSAKSKPKPTAPHTSSPSTPAHPVAESTQARNRKPSADTSSQQKKPSSIPQPGQSGPTSNDNQPEAQALDSDGQQPPVTSNQQDRETSPSTGNYSTNVPTHRQGNTSEKGSSTQKSPNNPQAPDQQPPSKPSATKLLAKNRPVKQSPTTQQPPTHSNQTPGLGAINQPAPPIISQPTLPKWSIPNKEKVVEKLLETAQRLLSTKFPAEQASEAMAAEIQQHKHTQDADVLLKQYQQQGPTSDLQAAAQELNKKLEGLSQEVTTSQELFSQLAADPTNSTKLQKHLDQRLDGLAAQATNLQTAQEQLASQPELIPSTPEVSFQQQYQDLAQSLAPGLKHAGDAAELAQNAQEVVKSLIAERTNSLIVDHLIGNKLRDLITKLDQPVRTQTGSLKLQQRANDLSLTLADLLGQLRKQKDIIEKVYYDEDTSDFINQKLPEANQKLLALEHSIKATEQALADLCKTFKVTPPKVSAPQLIDAEMVQEAIQAVLEATVPGIELIKVLSGARPMPKDVNECLQLAAETALDFLPTGKMLKAFKGAGTELALAKMKKVLKNRALKKAKQMAEGRAKPYSEATFKAFEKQLKRDGMKSILKTQARIQKNLAEHTQKLEQIRKAGGYSSSVEREIKTFQSQLDAIKVLLNN